MATSGWPEGIAVLLAGLGLLLAEAAIGLHDVLHDLVPDDVARPQMDELEPLDPLEDLLHHDQAGTLARWQVDLRDVAVDHGARPEPETCEEHLHLFR